jgi:hypothetical protein
MDANEDQSVTVFLIRYAMSVPVWPRDTGSFMHACNFFLLLYFCLKL